MKRRNRVTTVAATLALAALGASIGFLRVGAEERREATLTDTMYVQSPMALKRMSLGYRGLMADLYWTRAVQYFGGKHHVHSMQYHLLAPTLDIATTLDPQLTVAYNFGSLFLAQEPPEGAGDKVAAEKLVMKGIAANPQAWRLYYSLGTLQWLELHNELKASQTFEKGSHIPGAASWMSVMAASLAGQAGDQNTARYLWKNIYDGSSQKDVKQNAIKHLQCLDVDRDVIALEKLVAMYRERERKEPTSLQDLAQHGYLRYVPSDQTGEKYILRNGRVQVRSMEKLSFITQGRPDSNH